jgi:hypothetical protein
MQEPIDSEPRLTAEEQDRRLEVAIADIREERLRMEQENVQLRSLAAQGRLHYCLVACPELPRTECAGLAKIEPPRGIIAATWVCEKVVDPGVRATGGRNISQPSTCCAGRGYDGRETTRIKCA